MYRIVIVGGGKGGSSLLEIFSKNNDMSIVGIFDQSSQAEAFKLARDLQIPTYCDLQDITLLDCDIIVNVTGSYTVTKEIEELVPANIEVISNKSARVIWELIVSREKIVERMERYNKTLTFLHEIGILLSRSGSSEKAVKTALERSLDLTGAPSGSIAIYHQEENKMKNLFSIGFSDKFQQTEEWSVREGGITEMILKQNKPVVIDKQMIEENIAHQNIIDEGIKTVMAVSLVDRGEVIGILYNDYKIERKFSEEALNIIGLFATNASTAIKQIKENEFNQHLATTDGLTGLYNFRYFKHSLEREMKKSREMDFKLSLLLMDLDHFKKYNDNFGHLAGDEILKESAIIMRESIRVMDIPARYGGEEFAVILPGSSKEVAVSVAEKIRLRIEENAFSTGDKESINHKVTVSIGVCTFPDDTDDIQDFIDKADLALYVSKHAGRNQVNSFNSAMLPK
ncbi:MAG: GGDEF domain-containing protein [Nitrospinae bacterium]|nr:GGDEF domain-containing protein [Nitrospinota bacterium]